MRRQRLIRHAAFVEVEGERRLDAIRTGIVLEAARLPVHSTNFQEMVQRHVVPPSQVNFKTFARLKIFNTLSLM